MSRLRSFPRHLGAWVRRWSSVDTLIYAAKHIPVVSLHSINLCCAIYLFSENIGFVRMMAGPSMLPTLATSGEVVVENIISWRLHPERLRRGDLITFHSPLDPDRIVCKRVLGLPGDVVCVDPTSVEAPSGEHVVIPVGHVWVIGDNAACSRDSRTYGPVSMALIRSKLSARIWPWRDMTIFKNPATYLDE